MQSSPPRHPQLLTAQTGVEITIPDLLADWPYPPTIGSYTETLKESDDWLLSFGAFTPKMQVAFTRCNFGLLTLRSAPKVNKPAMLAGCKVMNLFFLVDDHLDADDEASAREKACIIKDVLCDPYKPRSPGEWIGGEIARQTFVATTESYTLITQRRLAREFSKFVDGVVAQAKDRMENRIPTFSEYLRLRRFTIGAVPAFTNMEAHMNIPDEASDHPIVQLLRICAADMIIITNDLTSYNKEQATGSDLHNGITSLMVHEGLDLQSAINSLADYNTRVAATFLTAKEHVPSFGEAIDAELRDYIDGIGNWVTANYIWHFESERYFGSQGMEILETRKVKLLPKKVSPPGISVGVPE